MTDTQLVGVMDREATQPASGVNAPSIYHASACEPLAHVALKTRRTATNPSAGPDVPLHARGPTTSTVRYPIRPEVWVKGRVSPTGRAS